MHKLSREVLQRIFESYWLPFWVYVMIQEREMERVVSMSYMITYFMPISPYPFACSVAWLLHVTSPRKRVLSADCQTMAPCGKPKDGWDKEFTKTFPLFGGDALSFFFICCVFVELQLNSNWICCFWSVFFGAGKLCSRDGLLQVLFFLFYCLEYRWLVSFACKYNDGKLWPFWKMRVEIFSR